MSKNFALSREGQLAIKTTPDYSVTSGSPPPPFDAEQNLRDVVHAALSFTSSPPSDALRFAAAAALQRQSQPANETDEEWAKRLGESFFGELNGRS